MPDSTPMQHPTPQSPVPLLPSALRKKHVRPHHRIPGVRLSLDELQQIIEILGAGSGEVVIEDGEYEYRDLDELATMKGTRRELEIRQTRPFVSVSVNRPFASVFSSDSSDTAIAMTSRIVEVLRNSRSKWPLSAIRGNILPLWGVASALGFISVFLQISLVTESVKLGAQSVLLLFFAALFLTSKIDPIILRSRRRDSTFWERKKDDLVVNLIILIVGILLGRLL